MSRLEHRVLRAVLVGLLFGCGERVEPFGTMTLPSGRNIKVQSYLPENLFTGEQALVLKYVPDARLDDPAALDAEVASIWKELRLHAETQAGTKLVLIRALPASTKGWEPGHPFQYVYRLEPDGSWSMEKDPAVRLH